MQKLPVFATFGNALGFAFGSFFTVFRLTWLPFVMLIASELAIGAYVQQMILHETPRLDPFSIGSHIDDFVIAQIVAIVLQAIAIAAAAVSVHRVILFGERKPRVYFNFPFGGTEFLYVLMGVVWVLILALVMAAVFTPAILLITGGDITHFFAKMQETFKDWPPSAEADAAKTVVTIAPLMGAYFIGWIIAIYVGLRLSVWPPAIVATRRFALGQAWALSRGNVLRFLGLFMLVGLLFYGIIAIPAGAAYWYYTTKMKPVAVEQSVDTPPSAIPPLPGANPPPMTAPTTAAGDTAVTDDEREAKQEEMRRAMERSMEEFQPYAPIIWFIELVFYVFGTGLGVALLSYSYKALKGYGARDPISDDA